MKYLGARVAKASWFAVSSLIIAGYAAPKVLAQESSRTTVLEGLDSFAPRLEVRPGAFGGIENGYRDRAGRWVIHGYVFDDRLEECDPAWMGIARQDVNFRNVPERPRLKGNFEHGKPVGKITVDLKHDDLSPELLASTSKTISDIEELLARKKYYNANEYLINGADRATLEAEVKTSKERLAKLAEQALINTESELSFSETDPGVPVGQWALRDAAGKIFETRSYSAEGKLLERTVNGEVVEMDQYISGAKKLRVPAAPPSMQWEVKFCEGRQPVQLYSESAQAVALAATGYKVFDRDTIVGSFVGGKPSGKIKVLSGSADKFKGAVVAELEYSETTPGVPSGQWVLRDRYGERAENRAYSAAGSLIEQRRFNGKSTDGLYRNRDGFIQKVDLVDGYASCEMQDGSKVRFAINPIGIIKRTTELQIAESSSELVTTLDSQSLGGLRGKDALQTDCPTLLGLAKEASSADHQKAIEGMVKRKASENRAKLEARSRGEDSMRRAICLILPALNTSVTDECREQFPGIEAEAESFRKKVAEVPAAAATPVVTPPVVPMVVKVDSMPVVKKPKAPVARPQSTPKKPVRRAKRGA